MRASTRARSNSLRGMTMIEAVLAAGIIAVLIAGVLSAAGAAATTSLRAAERSVAVQLADELLAEVTRRAYSDESGATTLGVDSGESMTCRMDANDVDDFDGWREAPPQLEDATPITSLSKWSRKVSVKWVNPADFSQTAASDTGVKVVTVTVYKGTTKILTRSALRCGVPTTGSASVAMPPSLNVTIGSGGLGLGLNLNLFGGN